MGRPCKCCDDRPPPPPGECPIFEYTLKGYYDADTGPDFNTDWDAVGLDTPGPIVDVSTLPSDIIILNTNPLPVGGGAVLSVEFPTGMPNDFFAQKAANPNFPNIIDTDIIIKYLDSNNYMFFRISWTICQQGSCSPCEEWQFQLGEQVNGNETLSGEIIYSKTFDWNAANIRVCWDGTNLIANFTIPNAIVQPANAGGQRKTLTWPRPDNLGESFAIAHNYFNYIDWFQYPITFLYSQNGVLIENCPICPDTIEPCWTVTSVDRSLGILCLPQTCWANLGPNAQYQLTAAAGNQFDVTCYTHPYFNLNLNPTPHKVDSVWEVPSTSLPGPPPRSSNFFRIYTNAIGLNSGAFGQIRINYVNEDEDGNPINAIEFWVEVGENIVVAGNDGAVQQMEKFGGAPHRFDLNTPGNIRVDLYLTVCLDENAVLSATASALLYDEQPNNLIEVGGFVGCAYTSPVRRNGPFAGYNANVDCFLTYFVHIGNRITAIPEFSNCPTCSKCDGCLIYGDILHRDWELKDGNCPAAPCSEDWTTIPINVNNNTVDNLPPNTTVVNLNSAEGDGVHWDFKDTLSDYNIAGSFPNQNDYIRWCVEWSDSNNYLYAEKRIIAANAVLYSIGIRNNGNDATLDQIVSHVSPFGDPHVPDYAELCYTGTVLSFNSRRIKQDGTAERFYLTQIAPNPGGGRSALQRTNWSEYDNVNGLDRWVYSKNGYTKPDCPTCKDQDNPGGNSGCPCEGDENRVIVSTNLGDYMLPLVSSQIDGVTQDFRCIWQDSFSLSSPCSINIQEFQLQEFTYVCLYDRMTITYDPSNNALTFTFSRVDQNLTCNNPLFNFYTETFTLTKSGNELIANGQTETWVAQNQYPLQQNVINVFDPNWAGTAPPFCDSQLLKQNGGQFYVEVECEQSGLP